MLQLSTLGATELRREDGTSLDSILAAPKRFALLSYLTLARPRGFHRRDVLLAMLWPELDQDRGRATLRTTLYHLRQALGADVLLTRGSDEIGIDRNALGCDAIEFERLLDEGHTAQALALYSGPLLTGVFVSGAPEWERWLETERARLRQRAMAAAWSLAEDAASGGNAETANRWARRAHEIQPDDEGSLRRLISVLDRIGDRAGAIAAHDAFARALWTEYESEPAPETRQLIESVRQRAPLLAPVPAFVPSVEPQGAIQPAITNETQSPPKRRIGPYHIAAGLAVLIVAGVGIVRAGSAPPVIAVGQIEMVNMPDSLGALPVVLGTNLARVPGLRIVSETRLHELFASLQSKRRPGADLTHAAAAAAGADEIIEGTLSQRRRGGYRLDLQRVDLAAGETRGAFTIESTEVFELIDLATEWVANELGTPVPPSRHGATVSSLVAYRLYENGLSAFYR